MRTVVASVLLVLLVALSTALAQAAPGPGRPDVPTVPAEFAAGEYQAFLEGVEKSFAATWPAQRLGAGADVLVFAATAAHVLGADTAPDWGERLYGERTKGRQAFDIVVGFQSGRFEQVAELPLCFSEAERKTRRTTPWGPLADALDAAAGAAPERQNWRDTATALRMAGFIRGGPANADPQQLEKYQAGSEPVRKALAAAVGELGGVRDRGLARLRMRLLSVLQRAMRERRLRDPHLGELLVRLTSDPRSRQGLAKTMSRYAPKLAVKAAETNLADRPDDPVALNGAAQALARAGRRGDGMALLRQAEKRVAYPGKREVRLRLFAMLRGGTPGTQDPQPRSKPRRGTRDTLAMHPGLAAERDRRSAEEAGLDPGEAEMARGDLLWVAMDHRQARAAYGQALEKARGPALKYAAWRAYAQCDPAGAWAKVSEIEPLLSGEMPPAPRAEFLDTAFTAGIAAEDLDAALTWVTQALAAEPATKSGPELLGKLVALHIAQGQEESAKQVLASAGDDYTAAKVLEAVLRANADNSTALFGRTGTLARAAAAATREQLDPAMLWHGAAKLACTAIGSFEQAVPVASIWMALTRAPPLADPEQRETALGALGSFVDAALAWVDARPQNDILAVSNLLQCVGTPLSGKDGLLVLPLCQRLFLGCLERGPARGVQPGVVAPRLQAYRNQLRRCNAPAEAVAAVAAAVEAQYPTLADPER